ncbi:UHRF1-like protein [Cryptotrichosporon argae]
MSVLSYEQQRLENIRANHALLLSLGLADAPPQPPPRAPPAPRAADKSPTAATDEPDGAKRASPYVRTQSRARPTPYARTTRTQGIPRTSRTPSAPDTLRSDGSLRRSLRARPAPTPNPGSPAVSVAERRTPTRHARIGKRTEDPKQFGHIPGVDVGTVWATRMACSEAAVHAPTVAGISGNAVDGAWSIALSGGYADDIDLGDAFTYTGSGGRDLKGTRSAPKNLRTAPQTSHQTFDNPLNAALKRSAETRLPVRVIRGPKLRGPFAPPEGYRYDGLYIVERAWTAPGLTNGLLVCRYALKRVDGQPAIPRNNHDIPDTIS